MAGMAGNGCVVTAARDVMGAGAGAGAGDANMTPSAGGGAGAGTGAAAVEITTVQRGGRAALVSDDPR